MTEKVSTGQKQIYDLQNRLIETKSKLFDLATMGALVASIRDLDTILSVVMEMSIRTVDAEVGLIQLEEKDDLVSKVTWGVDDFVIKNILYNDQDIATYCFQNQQPLRLNRNDPTVQLGQTVSCLIAMPIKSRLKCHGVVVVINKTTGEYFSEDDLENLEVLLNFAAVAIDNANLLKESLAKQKIEQELAIAKQVQQTILPENEIQIADIEIGTIYSPARFVGGDFYDIIKINEDEFIVVIGDVSNKGTPAAMLMAAAMAIIRSEIQSKPNIAPAELVSNLNNVLCTGIMRSIDMFVTLFIARFDLRQKRLLYCNAGHNFPLYWHSSRKDISQLNQGGTFVGQFPGFPYKNGEFQVNTGDRLMAYTDGVTEAENVNKEQYGTNRLKESFIRDIATPPAEFCRNIKVWVDRFTEGAGDESFDDFTVIEIVVNRD